MSQLENLKLTPRILSAALKGGLKNFDSILCVSVNDICRLTGLTKTESEELKTCVSKAVIPRELATVEQICKGEYGCTHKKLSTGCDIFDTHLSGGIISPGVTEIAGESASGKTQLCLQLSLTVQLPEELGGLEGGAAYVCTEDVFPNKRLDQMIQYFHNRVSFKLPIKKSYGDHIFIEHASDIESLHHCIDKRIPVLLKMKKIKIVIIDSIAALFRCEYNSSEMIKRSKDLWTLGAKLHSLSYQFSVPVICVNQVTDSMEKDGRKCLPSLGLTWSNQVNCRFMLERTPRTLSLPRKIINNNSVIGGIETSLRLFEVVFAPHLANVKFPFVIDQEGIKGVT